MACLRRFLTSPACLGLVVTEFNPDRDRDGALARRLIAALAKALTAAKPAIRGSLDARAPTDATGSA